jgi:peptidylprolyl isomerase
MEEQQLSAGDLAKIEFIIRLKDGTQFSVSKGRQALEFTVGEDNGVPKEFEEGLMGMTPKETRMVSISADTAFGPNRNEFLRSFAKTEIPEGKLNLTGNTVLVKRANGKFVPTVVTDVDPNRVTVDAEGIFEGKEMVADVTLLRIGPEVEEAAEEEIEGAEETTV